MLPLGHRLAGFSTIVIALVTSPWAFGHARLSSEQIKNLVYVKLFRTSPMFHQLRNHKVRHALNISDDEFETIKMVGLKVYPQALCADPKRPGQNMCFYNVPNVKPEVCDRHLVKILGKNRYNRLRQITLQRQITGKISAFRGAHSPYYSLLLENVLSRNDRQAVSALVQQEEKELADLKNQYFADRQRWPARHRQFREKWDAIIEQFMSKSLYKKIVADLGEPFPTQANQYSPWR